MTQKLDIPIRKTRRARNKSLNDLDELVGCRVIANILEFDDRFNPAVRIGYKIVGILRARARQNRIFGGDYSIEGIVYVKDPNGDDIILDYRYRRADYEDQLGNFVVDETNISQRELRYIKEKKR